MFEIGEQPGRKEDLRQVSQAMRKAKGERSACFPGKCGEPKPKYKEDYKDFSSVGPPRDGDGQVRLRAPRFTINLTRN